MRSTINRPLPIVLLTKTGPRCISFRCKITVSLAQGAVYDAEADVADPVFVRSTIGPWIPVAAPYRLGSGINAIPVTEERALATPPPVEAIHDFLRFV